MVVLYGQLGTPEFAVLHGALTSMAAEGRITYIFRHYIKVIGCVSGHCVYGVGVGVWLLSIHVDVSLCTHT